MADKTQTYSVTDWSIWTYVPESGAFQLDFSKLDTGTLGSTGGSYSKQTNAKITGIVITEGSTPVNGIFLAPVPTSATVSIQVKNATAATFGTYVVGAKFALTVKNGDAGAGDYLGGTPYFIGRIRSIDWNIQPGTDYTVATIQATTRLEDDLNYQYTFSKTSTNDKATTLFWSWYPGQWTEDFFGLFGYDQGLGYAQYAGQLSNYHYPVQTEKQTWGQFFTELIQTENFIPLDRPFYIGNKLDTAYPFSIYSYSNVYNFNESMSFHRFVSGTKGSSVNTYTDSTITDMTVGYSGADSPTAVSLALYSNSATTYSASNSYSSSLGSVNNYTATPDVQNSTELTAVGNAYLASQRSFSPTTITVVTARSNQNLTWKEVSYPIYPGSTNWKGYAYPVNDSNVGDTITVNSSKYGFNETLLITQKTIEINYDGWYTTYSLWRGL